MRLLRAVAQETQRNHENVNIAKLSGASASLAGGGLVIGGFVAAFFTFGVSLIISGVGVGLATTGGAIISGSTLAEHLLSKSQAKVVQAALDADRKKTKELDELLKKIAKAQSNLNMAVQTGKLGAAMGVGFKTAYTIGTNVAAAAESGGQAFVRCLSNVGRGLHFAGFAFSVALIPLDIHTLVQTSIKVHKGSIPDIVKDINKTADDLEAELKEFEKAWYQ